MLKKIIGLLLSWCMVFVIGIGSIVHAAEPVKMQEAQELLDYLYDISGKGILSGQFNYIEDPNYWTNEVYNITGKYPALWGGDFSYYFGIDLNTARQNLVDTAIEQWENGSIVSLCFHEQKPSDPPDAGWSSVQGWYTDEEMTELVTPGTDLYNQWLEDIDSIAGYLKQLRDAGVPVLWRPYHEMNGGWFWWGGRPDQFIQLWRNMYDRFTNYHGLDNLIWVWCPNMNDPQWTQDFSLFYPGHEYVDVLAQDIYYNSYYDSYYQQLLNVADGKPIAIGECGELPDIDNIRYNQPGYVYFMEWGKMLTENNTVETIQTVYSNPYTLVREQSLISNYEFDDGVTDWYWLQSDTADGNMSVVEGAGLSGPNALKVELNNGGAYSWNAQVNHVFPIESGKTYNISFMAKADTTKPIEVIIQQDSGSYDIYLYKNIDVTASVQTFGPYSFMSNVTDPYAVLRFNVGGNSVPIYIDKVLITEE